MSVVLLFGNGLSCGFDARLATAALTERVLARLGPDYVEVLEDLAELASPEDVDRPLSVDRGSFEKLAGPVDRIADAMRSIQLLLASTDSKVLDGLRTASDELRLHYLRIVGSVLAEVDACCTDTDADAEGKASWGRLNDFASSLCAFQRRVSSTFFTLNYDSLLMSSLLETGETVYDGFRYGSLNIPLSRWGDSPALYHLHGSVAWILNEDGVLDKPSLEYVRAVEAVEDWSQGKPAKGWPSVALGDMKTRQVARFPFLALLLRTANQAPSGRDRGRRRLQLR